MYDTATRSQFIDLRARGWSYDKIARHLGLSKSTLVAWGREYADDIARLKYESLFRIPAERADGPAQESYFHNLEGYPAERNSRSGKTSGFKRKLRKLLKSPLVRAALRYAIFRH